jgi:WD40 repeat protein
VKIWSVDNRNLVKSYAGHTGRVNSISFTKIDNIVISGGHDMSVKLWNVKSGHIRGEFFCQGPATCVNSEVIDNELVLLFGDSIGNLYLSKLHQTRH